MDDDSTLNSLLDSQGVFKRSDAYHHRMGGLADDDHSQNPLISTGVVDPSSTPTRQGALYINTSNGSRWVASGTGSANDWERLGDIGWQPFAFQPGLVTASISSRETLAANGGSIATPIALQSPMLLDAAGFVLGSSVMPSPVHVIWGWDLYIQKNPADNSGVRIAKSAVDRDSTDTSQQAYSIRAENPIYLPCGLYWLVIQNRHPFDTLDDLGNTASGFGGFANMSQVKTTTIPNGATLNLSSGWLRRVRMGGGTLHGRVFGQTTKYF